MKTNSLRKGENFLADFKKFFFNSKTNEQSSKQKIGKSAHCAHAETLVGVKCNGCSGNCLVESFFSQNVVY
jgi:hypothetical protein